MLDLIYAFETIIAVPSVFYLLISGTISLIAAGFLLIQFPLFEVSSNCMTQKPPHSSAWQWSS